MIQEVAITKEMLDEAKKRNASFEKKYGNIGTHRINKSKQRMTGYLAEVAIKHLCGVEYSDEDSVDFKYNGITLDSKAQGCNSKPKEYYVATLYEEQKKRDVDLYIFSRVKNDWSKVWVCGFLSKEEFFKKSKLIPAGTQNNNFTYDQSRFEIEYSKLKSIKDLEKINENKVEILADGCENLFLCKNTKHHKDIDCQLHKLAFELVRNKIITFNKETGEYEIQWDSLKTR